VCLLVSPLEKYAKKLSTHIMRCVGGRFWGLRLSHRYFGRRAEKVVSHDKGDKLGFMSMLMGDGVVVGNVVVLLERSEDVMYFKICRESFPNVPLTEPKLVQRCLLSRRRVGVWKCPGTPTYITSQENVIVLEGAASTWPCHNVSTRCEYWSGLDDVK